MATLKFSIKEELVLNGANRGSENVISITGITQSFHRIVTCPLNEDTTVATFRNKVSTSATAPVDGALDLEDVKYIRVTNLDATNPVNLSLQIAGGEARCSKYVYYYIARRWQDLYYGGSPRWCCYVRHKCNNSDSLKRFRKYTH